MKRAHIARALVSTVIALFLFAGTVQSEVILQYFNNSWNEISAKIPELAEVGYTALWLPPPQKCSGGSSVGYDLWDPFDLGSKDQRGTVTTRYGTEEQLLRLIETAHRFGMRVYFDNIMNHRAFDIPGYNADTPIDIYPGMLPEDFHLRVTEEGFYRKWNNTENWGNTWQVQYQNLSDLIDIAQETPNGNFGPSEGSTHTKISFVRHPNNPEYYDYHPSLGWVGFGTTNITTNTIAQNPEFYKEDVGGYLMRSVRWLVYKTKVDGLRLDAVKHVPSYFFGEQYDVNKDSNSNGYCGHAQWEFDKVRGFIDSDNYRDTVFDTEKSYGRNDLMMFGEHMGEPPPYDEYWAAGMRLLDARTHQTFNDAFGNSWGSLSGLDSADYISGKQMGRYLGVYYAKSHDDNVAYHEELHNAMNLTRAGLPVIYTDGNRHAETLGQSGGAFPRHANTAYLGQWGDNKIVNLVSIHNNFARADHVSISSDSDVAIYERKDKRENTGMSDASGTVLLMMVNDNYTDGQSRSFTTTFPHTSGGDNTYLYNYSTYGGGFYVWADQLGSVIIPPGGYFAFSIRNPEESELWKNGGGKPVTVYQNGEPAPMLSYVRTDGADGDASFNPYGITDTNTTDYAYTWSVPRVTVATNLKFCTRVDGSAANVLMKLDGGINLNTNKHLLSGDDRDHPPGNEGSFDVFLGYEQAGFGQRTGQEKFGSLDSVRNRIGSAGAETYVFTVGSAGFTINPCSETNDWSNTYTASFVYHNPSNQTDHGYSQFWPAPQNATNANIYLWVKTGHQGDVNRVYVYYTTDGATWPEGAGGMGIGNTKVVELYWKTNVVEGLYTNDWWGESYIPAQAAGTTVRYKISATRLQGADGMAWDVPYPDGAGNVARKTKMMGVWTTDYVNAQTVVYHPHNDWSPNTSTGLVEGFHVISARAFLDRPGKASIYNTFVQPFYFDASTPTGEVKYPSEGDTLYQSEYGVVVRTDPTVEEVWYNIADSDFANDDAATSNEYGNGTNLLGQTAWVKAYEVTPTLGITSVYPKEWRFSFFNIPTNDTATIRVKLLELSSTTNLNGTDAAEHFTTLQRTVTCRAPTTTFQYDWPTQDGTLVASGWTVRVKFSSSLVDGYDDTAMYNNFLITINGSAQSRSDYSITRDTGGGLGQIEFNLPDLYNGDTNFLHQITFSLDTSGGVTRQASRYVKAQQSAASILVQITDPPEVDSDGQPFVIILPDVASPSSTQRQYSIRVETDLSAKNMWLSFVNGVGYTTPYASTSNQLSGTVSVVSGSNVVTGTGTLFDSQLGAGNLIKIDTNYLIVSQVVASNVITLTTAYPGANASGLVAYRIDPNPSTSGSKQYWNFLWTNMTEGYFTFVANVDTNNNTNTVEASATRNVTVILREYVGANGSDDDDDDDGLYDSCETAATNLPDTNAETWRNGQVHIWYVYGKTDPLRPDTDGDGLSDGLESGWASAASATDTNVDTNGDGWKNFRSDIDPPFFNTVPDNSGVPGYVFYDSRTKLIAGTMTDPNNADSDYDGLSDGLEDANRNGWVDGDGDPLYPGGTRTNWPTKAWSSSWTETDPNNSDSDRDLASDGYGEDVNFNGWIDGDTNSNRIWEAGELWQEANPLNPDTDGDSLPDGWEKRYSLDPLDDGVMSHTNMRTGAIIATNRNGASGNPDGDVIIQGGLTNPYINLIEYQNGTDPTISDNVPVPTNATATIHVGPGDVLGVLTGTGTNYEEFTEWTADDCLVLDAYEGDGGNNQQGDTYLAYDGYDSSRDIVAFYAHDGGDTSQGGDGRFYFRVDFQDLVAGAEEGNLDIYVVVDTGNPASGNTDLPDEVDLVTSCRWECVVAVYQSGMGQVYTSPTTTAPGAFIDAYFNSTLDSCEFSINRSALTNWNGDIGNLHFQVFTTKDGTCNSCGTDGAVGAGDIGGRNDVRDTIYDDEVAEDYWMSQASIKNVLSYWFSGSDRAGHAKLATVIHANQADQPGSYIQTLINDGAGAGYNRPLGVHELYRLPLNLHITPVLAAALEWAKTDPAVSESWRTNYYANGPMFNDWIATLYRTNVIALLGSTFSDHILPYFTKEFNRDNVSLANEFLGQIYGFVQKTNTVFWTPERVLDDDVLDKILDIGYEYTLIDQSTHMWQWLGRNTALGDGGYRINRFNGVKCFVMNDGASGYRFSNTDNGLPTALRSLLNRKARSDTQDQVVTMLSNWEDFSNLTSANAYDRNLIWLANHPWIEVVALEDIAASRIDKTWDGLGDAWYVEDRGTAGRPKVANDWLHHATETNYNHWYIGSQYEESLQSNYFEIRAGVPLPKPYGMQAIVPGIAIDTWNQVTSVADTNLGKLARGILHASVFETAFHAQTNSTSIERYSTGEYIYQDTSYEPLIDFSRFAQAQTRLAAVVERVDDWEAVASSITNVQVSAEDIDQDGEDEYLLYNDRLFGAFERIGGRLVGVWVRDILNNRALEAAGNLMSYSGSATENEGTYNVESNGAVVARRTSCLKDWWASANGNQYINNLYTAINWTNGWRLTSSDSAVQKTITLAPKSWSFEVQYQMSGTMVGQPLYVRNGFSPNLYDLLLRGQQTLGSESHSAGVMMLANTNYETTVLATIGYADAGHNAGFNTGAVDDDLSKGVSFYTVNMRNQAQTHQVEMVGTNSFAFSLGFQAVPSDWDADGMPNTWDDQYGLSTNAQGGADQDADGDGMPNAKEYISGTSPLDNTDYLHLTAGGGSPTGIVVRFPTKTQREYFIHYDNLPLLNPTWALATSNAITGTGGIYQWLDDGSATDPDPISITNRFYRIEAALPQ